MNFLVDAQLPRRIAAFLRANGHYATHTLDLPDANHTADEEISRLADEENAVVITKDSDFVHSFLLRRKPTKLLLIATGNINNRELDALLTENLAQIVIGLETHGFVELTPTALIFRG